eukprot:1188301-Pyramimonas_sp.AAC.1
MYGVDLQIGAERNWLKIQQSKKCISKLISSRRSHVAKGGLRGLRGFPSGSPSGGTPSADELEFVTSKIASEHPKVRVTGYARPPLNRIYL